MQRIFYRSVRQSKLGTIDEPKRGSWVHVVNPSEEELESLQTKLGLDIDLLHDGTDLYESPRLEHEDDVVYLYVRYCFAKDNAETSTQPLLIIVKPELLVTIARQSDPLADLIATDESITTQKAKLLLQVLTHVNKGYRLYLNQVTKTIFASRRRLQKRIVSDADIIRFIDIEEDLNEILASLQPYGILLRALTSGRYFNFHEEDIDLIEDLELSTNELIELSKSRLKTIHNMRDAYSTIAANNLNRIFKLLTSISIFVAVPTIMGGIYGMNIPLPFASHEHAFLIVMSMTFIVLAGFVFVFRRKNWL